MPIHHAVLALLFGGDSHGYELKAEFEQSIGPQWGEINIGHLYQVLERLERDGFVTKREVPQPGRPDKNLYTLTAAGRTELDEWLATPFVRQSGYRDDFFLKLFAAARLGHEAVDQVVRVQRKAYLRELASLEDLRGRHQGDPLVRLLIEAAAFHTEANLRVIEAAEARAVDLDSSAVTRRQPDAHTPSARTKRASSERRVG
jgi:DNA-binding PadR family transcriptional regulator